MKGRLIRIGAVLAALITLITACAPSVATPPSGEVKNSVGVDEPATQEFKTFYIVFITSCGLPSSETFNGTTTIYSRNSPIVGHPQTGVTTAMIYGYWQPFKESEGLYSYRYFPDTNLDSASSECTIASRPEDAVFVSAGKKGVRKK